MSRIIISMSGKMLSGKDTTADYLVDTYEFKKLSFARNLKNMCQTVFQLEKHETDTQEGKAKKFPIPIMFSKHHLDGIIKWMRKTHVILPTNKIIKGLEKEYVNKLEFINPREILQVVGTEICRGICNSYHIDIIEQKIACNKDTNYVLVDSRYPNERDMLKKLDGILFLIKRDLEQSSQILHISENSLGIEEEYDYIIDNNGTILDLYDTISKIMEEIIL